MIFSRSRFLVLLAVVAGLSLSGGAAAAVPDNDGDGFTDAAEAFLGTDALSACSQTTTVSDEAIDAWPPDFNDDTQVDILDAVRFRNVYGSTSGDGTYDARLDLNTDGAINVSDVVMLRPFYGSACEPTPAPPSDTFVAEYYDNSDFTNLLLVRNDAAINFDWGVGPPDPSMGADTFSVHWTGNFGFAQGDYAFTARVDDGVRIWIDGGLVLDQWQDQLATTFTFTETLSAGTHTIAVDYYENASEAIIQLSWLRSQSTPTPTPTPTPAAVPTPTATATPDPSAGTWAFEETFDGDPPSPSQDLLPRTFDYVATHRTHPITPDGFDSNGSYGSFPADHGNDCAGPPNQHTVGSTTHRSNSANPDESFFRCKNHMMSSMGDVEGYSVTSFWPRQEFDFTDGGTLEFDVNINEPHDRQWWEILIVPRDQLQVGAAKDWLPIDETYPADRIVFDFSDRSWRSMHVGTGQAAPNGEIAREEECGNPCSWGSRHPGDPAVTDRRIRRTHHIELEANRISWGVQTEDGTFDTMSLNVPGGLPFDRGLVLFKTHAYTPTKADNLNIYTFHWDNIRFSGPVLPPYEIFESPVVVGRLGSVGETAIQEIELPYVGDNPVLFGQVHESLQGQVLLSINGGPNMVVEPHTLPECNNSGWRSFRIPLDPSTLQGGTNTFTWTVGARPSCAWSWDGFSIKGLEVQMDQDPSVFSQRSEASPAVQGPDYSAAAARSLGCSIDDSAGPAPSVFLLRGREATRRNGGSYR